MATQHPEVPALEKPKSCFVVMPISDVAGYTPGHFKRVYDHLIRPACKAAGYDPVRADDVKSSNYIVIDILKKILESDLVICDLSAKNPNVLYELGIRQAFDMPTVLIKDTSTDRIFDIQGLRTHDYDGSLRIDAVEADVTSIAAAITETMQNAGKEVNSLIRLLGIHKAVVAHPTEVSADTAVILNAIKDVSTRLSVVEGRGTRPSFSLQRVREDVIRRYPTMASISEPIRLPYGGSATFGDPIFDSRNRQEIGSLVDASKHQILLRTPEGAILKVDAEDEMFQHLTDIPPF